MYKHWELNDENKDLELNGEHSNVRLNGEHVDLELNGAYKGLERVNREEFVANISAFTWVDLEPLQP